MPFCPSCKYEYRLGVDRCADCDEALLEQLPTANPHGAENQRPGVAEQESPAPGERRAFYGLLGGCLAALLIVIGPLAMALWAFHKAYGDAALVAAASNGDAARVRKLLASGSNPNSSHIEGSSALWWAVQSRSPETVKLLLDYGADINSRGQWDSVIDQAMQGFDSAPDAKSSGVIAALLVHGRELRDPDDLKQLRQAYQKAKQMKLPASLPAAPR